VFLGRLGFDDFLSYELDYDKGVDEREEIMLSVIQKWLFLGVLEQFSEIFELPIDLDHPKMVDGSGIERLCKIYLHSLITLQSNMVQQSINASGRPHAFRTVK
jgi:hypothetical protein